MASKKSNKNKTEKPERNVGLIIYRAMFILFSVLIAFAMIVTAIGF
jgi:hypothetical protein